MSERASRGLAFAQINKRIGRPCEARHRLAPTALDKRRRDDGSAAGAREPERRIDDTSYFGGAYVASVSTTNFL